MTESIVSLFTQIAQVSGHLPFAVQIAGLVVVILIVLQLTTLAYNTLARWQIARHTRGLRVLTEAMSRANRSFALKTALGDPLDLLLTHLQLPVGVIHLVEPDSRQLVLACARGSGASEHDSSLDILGDDTLMREAIKTGAPARMVGPADSGYLRALSGGSAQVCAIAVPIASGARTIGALTVAAPRYRAFTDDEVHLMLGLGQHLGVVVENLRMIEAMRAQMAQLDTALADLRLSQASRRDLGRLAHDLQTPLAAIQGYIRILLEGELPDSAREGLGLVAGRLEQVIAHIQAFGATEPQEIVCGAITESTSAQPRQVSATPVAEVVLTVPRADAPAGLDLQEPTPQALAPAAQPVVPETDVSGSPVPAPPGESWRMEAPILPRSKPSSWLAGRLARLDRLQRIALGVGCAVLFVAIIFVTVVSVWQQSHW